MSQNSHRASERTKWLKHQALELGFVSVGVSKAEELSDEAPRLERWLTGGMNGEMKYMEGYFDKRLDPRKLVPGTKSVVSLLFNYHNPNSNTREGEYKISQYALGTDYHFVLKRKLKELLRMMKEEWGDVDGRVFVDSAPVLERAWAAKSGLGWIGKNSLLLSKKLGSYFFTAEMMLDVEFEYDVPVVDHCGSCTSCIDACPTGAIIKPYVVDGSKCISYFTIELKGEIPEPMAGKFDEWIFGCDVCQEACPWNRHSTPTKEPEFEPPNGLLEMTKSDWVDLTEEVFRDYFKSSPIMRAGFEGLKRNIKFLVK
ncbi:MAG: tRNA epoxyqueuosine(34) reductase QueG [Crocinitomicaceae bacterium]|nr:tRNA epoxyqueuosine(34) reductase QueG [Crocinitomicaceae bacterium]|tara:strand:- start:16689 stop:17627 length:939 start_codon:yes stop_codon:yes gene_type:complete